MKADGIGVAVRETLDYADYPALKIRYKCIKPAGTGLVDDTGNVPDSAPQGTLAPWTDETAVITTSQATYTNSFTALPAENAGVSACYPGLTGVTMVHFYAQLEASVGEPYGIVCFGGGYQQGNTGAPDVDGGAFGVGMSLSSLIAWARDDSQVAAYTTWMSGESMGAIPTLEQASMADGNFHSIQVLFMPSKSQIAGREGWIVAYIDGDQAGLPRVFETTTGISAGSAPSGVGYDFLPFMSSRNTTASFGQGFHGVCKQVQIWKFASLPSNLDLAIKELNARPRDVPLSLKGVA